MVKDVARRMPRKPTGLAGSKTPPKNPKPRSRTTRKPMGMSRPKTFPR